MASLFGYQAKETPIHRLNAVTKLVYFLVSTLAVMLTFDTRLVIVVTLVSLYGLKLAKVEWQDVRFVVAFMSFFSVLNLLTVFLLAPHYGETLYNSRTILFGGEAHYALSAEQLFYEFNILMKYVATIPLVLMFMLTMNPSDFAASFNRIGVPYRMAYSVALTLRYIPDVQRDYVNIRNAQEARGVNTAGKKTLASRMKQMVTLAFPLILTSFNRIDTISQAMLLRRFGHGKKRTWYVAQKMTQRDYLIIGLSLLWLVAYAICFVLNDGRFYNPFK